MKPADLLVTYLEETSDMTQLAAIDPPESV